jgi:hypothetical protein
MRKLELNCARNLSFEINRGCNMAELHTLCPSANPIRYKYSTSKKPITDDLIFDFWKWCTEKHYFRGILNWNGYNEPSLVINRIHGLLRRMRKIDPGLPSQLVTNDDNFQSDEFEIIKRSRYGEGGTRLCDDRRPQFDNRLLAALQGEGKPYTRMAPFGRCVRGMGWEIIIDYYGNWVMCCADFSCENSFGNIWKDDWEGIYQIACAQYSAIRWTNEIEYYKLPRLCRACLSVNPSLHIREDIDIIRAWPEGKTE